MIEGLKPYGKYKESGSKWLGAVPAKWEVRNLRTLISKRTERDRPDLPLLSVAREKGVFIRSLTDADENHNIIPDDLRNYKVARAGNLVINKMKAWQGSMGIAPCDGIVSPAYFVFDFGIANHAFGQLLLRSKPYVAHFGQASDGVRVGQWDLSVPGMRQIPVLVPSDEEQAAIVRFLDHENRKIDGFIRAKRKLIGLLNERKQAIIHRAVTRGHNPDVPLKPSGVPWLGDIPKHWEPVRSRRLFTVRTELARPGDVQLSATQAYGVIPQAAYEAKIGRRVVKITMHLEKRSHVEKDDFVISMRSFQGGIERAWASGAIRSSYIVMKPDPKVDVTFFSYVLKSPSYIRALQATGNFIRDGQDLTFANFRMVDLPLPPIAEQQQIAEFIGLSTSGLNASLSRIEREISLIQVYRTRLTADVVTGKLDVREAASKLPDVPVDSSTEPVREEALEEIEPEELES